MFCKYCGKQLAEAGQKCPHCGHEQGSLSSLDGYFGILRAAGAPDSENSIKPSGRVVLREERKEAAKEASEKIERMQNESLAKIEEIASQQEEQEKMLCGLDIGINRMKIMTVFCAAACILICFVNTAITWTTYRSVKAERDEVSQTAVKAEEMAEIMQTTYQSVQEAYQAVQTLSQSVQTEYEEIGRMAEKIEGLASQEPVDEEPGEKAEKLTDEGLEKTKGEGIEDAADEQNG